MAWMYILHCADGSFYTGSTVGEPEARVWEHNHDDDRAARYTRERRPVALLYAEEYERVEDAFAREKQVQGWSRAKKRALMEHRGAADLPGLSRSRGRGASPSSATGDGVQRTKPGGQRPEADGRRP